MLIAYYKQEKRFAVELYHLLRQQRLHEATDFILLRDELVLAEKIEDYEAACDISAQLLELQPNNPIVLDSLLEMNLSDAGVILALTSIYISIHEFAFAIEFLYHSIKITNNQQLRDFFFKQAVRSKLSGLVFEAKDVVEPNDLVKIDYGTRIKEVEASIGSVYADLIGKCKGEKVVLHQREVRRAWQQPSALQGIHPLRPHQPGHQQHQRAPEHQRGS